jgi:hypothetical protein
MRNQRFFPAFLALLAVSLLLVLPTSAQTVSDLALTPGADASQLNVAWITDASSADTCAVQIAKASTGLKQASTFTSQKVIQASAASKDGTYYYCHVGVTGLKNQVDYVYKVGDGSTFTGAYTYSTRNRNKYGFVFLSDAQQGASGNLTNDLAGWSNTVKAIGDNFPQTAFIMSAGDQIEHPGVATEWTNFLTPAGLRSIPVAPTPSSHDELGTGQGGAPSSYAIDYHFNLPNESARWQITADANGCPPPGGPPPPPGTPAPPPCTPNMQQFYLATGDYYFTYGDALFMVLNMDSTDYDGHEAFMQVAIAANPDIRWKVAMWHYTIYTAASRPSNLSRTEMLDIMDDLKIDVVLQGHDHVYCRTWQMLNNEPQINVATSAKGEVLSPAGTLYLTTDSASGSKYYDLGTNVTIDPTGAWFWVADYWQAKAPTFSYITVDANSLSISTYRTDTMATIDTYTIKKVGK